MCLISGRARNDMVQERADKMSCKSCSRPSMCSAKCPKCASKKLAHEAGSHYCYVCGDFTAGHSLPGCNVLDTVKQTGPWKETMLNGIWDDPMSCRGCGKALNDDVPLGSLASQGFCSFACWKKVLPVEFAEDQADVIAGRGPCCGRVDTSKWLPRERKARRDSNSKLSGLNSRKRKSSKKRRSSRKSRK